MATADATFTVLTIGDWGGVAAAGMTLKVGQTIYGKITAITLAGGSAVAYKEV